MVPPPAELPAVMGGVQVEKVVTVTVVSVAIKTIVVLPLEVMAPPMTKAIGTRQRNIVATTAHQVSWVHQVRLVVLNSL